MCAHAHSQHTDHNHAVHVDMTTEQPKPIWLWQEHKHQGLNGSAKKSDLANSIHSVQKLSLILGKISEVVVDAGANLS